MVYWDKCLIYKGKVGDTLCDSFDVGLLASPGRLTRVYELGRHDNAFVVLAQ